MASHEDIYPLILAEAPGCPLPLVDLNINRAAREFCEKSATWVEDLDAITTKAGTWLYDLDVPNEAALLAVLNVRMATADLCPSASIRDPLRWDSASGPPRIYGLRQASRELMLYPTPVGEEPLWVRVQLQPTLNANSLTDILVDRYAEALAEGVKSLIKRMPNQPWSDPAGAQLSYQLFQQHISSARIDAEIGSVAQSLSVTPRAFGA